MGSEGGDTGGKTTVILEAQSEIHPHLPLTLVLSTPPHPMVTCLLEAKECPQS